VYKPVIPSVAEESLRITRDPSTGSGWRHPDKCNRPTSFVSGLSQSSRLRETVLSAAWFRL